MLSLNPFKKPSRIPDETRCTRIFANGARCRNPIAHDSPNLCAFHSGQAAKEQAEAEAAALIKELYGQVGNLDSELAVAQVLANLFRLIAQDRIPPRRAALLASTARAILRALKDNRIAQRHQSLETRQASKQARAEAEEKENRRINAGLAAWARSFGQPESEHRVVAAGLDRPGFRQTVRSEEPAEASIALNDKTPPPDSNDNPTLQSRPQLSTLNAKPSTAPTAPHSKSSARPKTAAEPAPSAPKICYTYQEAFAETLRQSPITDPDLPAPVSEDIAVHNGDVNRKKWDGGPIKFGFRWSGPPRNPRR
jgi:hypothetical protein